MISNEKYVHVKMPFFRLIVLAFVGGATAINIDKTKFDEAMVLGADGQV